MAATKKDHSSVTLRIESDCYKPGRPELSLWYLRGAAVTQPSLQGTWILLVFSFQELHFRDFPGGAVAKNPPANAGDTGSFPGPGRSHMPRSN